MKINKVRIVDLKEKNKISSTIDYTKIVDSCTCFIQDEDEILIGMITINWNNTDNNTYNMVTRDGNEMEHSSMKKIIKYCDGRHYQIFVQS